MIIEIYDGQKTCECSENGDYKLVAHCGSTYRTEIVFCKNCISHLREIPIPKKKVKKWKFLYTYKNVDSDCVFLTVRHHRSGEDFIKNSPLMIIVLSKVPESEIEVEE